MRTETFSAFSGHRQIAAGDLQSVALGIARASKSGLEQIIVLSDLTGRPIDLDLRGSETEIAARYQPSAAEPPAKPGRGRPKLGVVPREVTLLTGHWDWLATQPGGASATLRKLVHQARRQSGTADRRRAAQDAAYRIMMTLAGQLPDFEEALRAFYADDAERFQQLSQTWPAELRDHIRERVAAVWMDLDPD